MEGKDPDNTAVTGQVDQQPLLADPNAQQQQPMMAAQPVMQPGMGQPVMQPGMQPMQPGMQPMQPGMQPMQPGMQPMDPNMQMQYQTP